MEEVATPDSSVQIKVRRFVPTEIPDILALVSQFDLDEGRINFLLKQNARNVLFHADVLLVNGEVKGILMAQPSYGLSKDGMVGWDVLFFISPDQREFGIKLMLENYKDWAKQRGIKNIIFSNEYMRDELSIGHPMEMISTWNIGVKDNGPT